MRIDGATGYASDAKYRLAFLVCREHWVVILGFITNANVVVFAYLGKRFSTLPRTTIQGTTNMFNMGGGPIYQLIIGWLIVLETGYLSRQLNAEMMQRPLWLIPISLMILFIVLLFSSIPSMNNAT